MNSALAASSGVFYEQEVRSFRVLSKKLSVLDQDSGVRVLGGAGKKRFYVFVTRFGSKYTVIIYGMKRGSGAPGKKLETLEFESVVHLEDALRRLVRGKLRAWIY